MKITTKLLDNVKLTIEIVALPLVAAVAVWGPNIDDIVGATVICAVSLLTYAGFWVKRKEDKEGK